jgi:hypothetical protein
LQERADFVSDTTHLTRSRSRTAGLSSALAVDLIAIAVFPTTADAAGTMMPPAASDVTNAAAAQAQIDLTDGFVNAAGRPVAATTVADLLDYSFPDRQAALAITGWSCMRLDHDDHY